MSILGYTRSIDPAFQKKCLQTWIELGSADRAGKELGIKGFSVSRNAWRYLFDNVDEARKILSEEAVKDPRIHRELTEEEFWRKMIVRAMTHASVTYFYDWIIHNGIPLNFPQLMELYRYKYPEWYRRHKEYAERHSGKVQE